MKRLNIQLDDETDDRLRILAFQTQTPAADVIRRCIAAALDNVELAVVREAKQAGKLRAMTSPQMEHLTTLIMAEILPEKPEDPKP